MAPIHYSHIPWAGLGLWRFELCILVWMGVLRLWVASLSYFVSATFFFSLVFCFICFWHSHGRLSGGFRLRFLSKGFHFHSATALSTITRVARIGTEMVEQEAPPGRFTNNTDLFLVMSLLSVLSLLYVYLVHPFYMQPSSPSSSSASEAPYAQ